MTNTEKQIWELVHEWCNAQSCEIPDFNRRALMERILALRQPPVISCVCPNEIKTGTVSIHCCNLCGKPDEDWWGKLTANV